MGKAEEDFWTVLGALILGKILLDALKKYRCPRCNYPVSKDNFVCPNCGQPLNWRSVDG